MRTPLVQYTAGIFKKKKKKAVIYKKWYCLLLVSAETLHFCSHFFVPGKDCKGGGAEEVVLFLQGPWRHKVNAWKDF